MSEKIDNKKVKLKIEQKVSKICALLNEDENNEKTGKKLCRDKNGRKTRKLKKTRTNKQSKGNKKNL